MEGTMTKYIDIERLRAEINKIRHDWLDDSTGLEVGEFGAELGAAESILDSIDDVINSLQQEQTEIGLEEFTQKMDDWKARYNHPDNVSIKATMAFTARMFYMHPDIAREWYDNLPKVTQD